MEPYKLIIRQMAFDDLREIYFHIARVLNEPLAAERIHRSIAEGIKGLSTLPMRYQLMNDEPYRSLGYRMLQIKNYIIYYIVDQERRIVHVVRILYNRRDWQNLL